MLLKTRLLEVWAIMRVLNTTRLMNALMVFLTYWWSRMTKTIILSFKPYAVSIEPTSTCNLKCPECPTGTNDLKRPRGNINLKNFQKMLDQLSPEMIYLNLYVQGEPTIHPQFPEMLHLASQKNIYTSSSTNGQFITEQMAQKIVASGLTRLIFSMDGVTQKSYETYRIGGKLSKVIDSIKHITAAKKQQKKNYPLVVIQFLVFEHNQNEIKSIQKLTKELNADKLELKTAQLHTQSDSILKAPRKKKYRRYRKDNDQQLKGKFYNHCWRQWHSTVISWDGQLAPCCYDKDASYKFGNINNTSLLELWTGNKSKRFKKDILFNKQAISICHNCPEGRTFWK